MPDIAMERAHLAQADRDIRDGERRVLRQAELVAHLRARGQNSAEAETLLRVLRDTLQVWQAHRHQILRMLAKPQG